MNKIPLTIVLFTSTKGHFDIKNRYLETIQSLDKQIPLSEFFNLVAHIKYSSGEESQLEEMALNLEKQGFKVLCSNGSWSHGDQSHQNGYLKDLYTVYASEEVLNSEYVLHMEDDWKFHCSKMKLTHWINEALSILDSSCDLVQVRFARFSNEFERINKLKEKHGLNAYAIKSCDDAFFHNDFSLNPSIFRSRDLFSAINLVRKNPQTFSQHVEHGISSAIKYLYDLSELPFYCFDPEKIKVMHIGTPAGQEDTDKQIISN